MFVCKNAFVLATFKSVGLEGVFGVGAGERLVGGGRDSLWEKAVVGRWVGDAAGQ